MLFIRHCCKNCEELNYYDGYFCNLGKVLNEESATEIGYIINDIDNTKCEMFVLRKEKFWTYEDGGF